jgi:hypothetical protein
MDSLLASGAALGTPSMCIRCMSFPLFVQAGGNWRSESGDSGNRRAQRAPLACGNRLRIEAPARGGVFGVGAPRGFRVRFPVIGARRRPFEKSR